MPRVLLLFSTNISFMRFVLSLRVKFANEVEQALSIRKLEHVWTYLQTLYMFTLLPLCSSWVENEYLWGHCKCILGVAEWLQTLLHAYIFSVTKTDVPLKPISFFIISENKP